MRGFYARLSRRLCRVFLDAVLATSSALLEELGLDGRLLEIGTLTEFFENTGALILLLEAAQCAIDRFVILYDDTYHS